MADPLSTSEKLIAAELSKLSLQEREKAYEDVHGVSDLVEESPERVESSLLELERELAFISSKVAFDQAELASKEYVSDRKLRLMYLRAALFDPKKAASRLVGFFDLKLDLFGADKLGKAITLEDLGEDGMEALRQGAQQVLSRRDSQGRAVVASNQGLFLSLIDRFQDPLLTLKRSFFYTMVSTADDEETQKKGMVYIVYAVESEQLPDAIRRELLKALGHMSTMFPSRCTAIHYCFGSTNTAPLWRAIVLGVGSVLRVRMRTHNGSHNECQYNLAAFGIDVTDFPFTSNGETKLSTHTKWLERRQNKEYFLKTNKPKEGAVDLPCKCDVLLGRGKPFNSHPGNKQLHEIVASFYKKYNGLLRAEKTKLAEEIVFMVRGYGGNFLKQDEKSGMWVAVSNLEARNKVAHGFRRKREFELKARTVATAPQALIVNAMSSKRMRVLLAPGKEDAGCYTIFCRKGM